MPSECVCTYQDKIHVQQSNINMSYAIVEFIFEIMDIRTYVLTA